ncbi:MAG: IS4 family transposase, partial [Spirochaetota bacterium]
MNRVYEQMDGKANQKRVLTLTKLLYAIIKSGHCSLSRMGQELLSPTDVESRVKQAKRWLDSKYSDYKSFFLPHIVPLLRGLAQRGPLLIAIDGSEVGKDCMALMVSVVWRKRALPVCWLVRKGKKGHMSVALHLEVLKQLANILPEGSEVVLLGDGEFDGYPLQAFCEKEHWKYALRTAKNSSIVMPNGECFAINELYPMPEHDHWLIEGIGFTQQGYGPVNCLVWHSSKYDEAIYLVSNLDWAKDIMDYYTRRFGVETLFGDIKSRGFNIHKTRIDNPERLNALLMVVCIAFLLVFALATFRNKLQKYLPKFLRKDRIHAYSFFQIGLRAFRFFIKQQLKIFPQFTNNYQQFIC